MGRWKEEGGLRDRKLIISLGKIDGVNGRENWVV